MLKKVISDERGRALALALIVLGVGALLLPAFLAHISTNLLASQATEVGITEYYGADAAIEYTLWQIKCNTEDFLDGLEVGETKSYTIPIGGSGVVSVSLTPLSSAGGSNEVDAMLVLDRSGSMDDDGNGCTLPDYDNQTACESAGGVWGPQPITSAKVAAKVFVDILEDYSVEGVSHQVGLVSYSDEITLDPGLTTVFTDVRNEIDGMTANGHTNIGGAIAAAAQELQDNGRENRVKAIVLLSDGKANVCPEDYGYCCSDPGWGCYDRDDCEGPCATYAEDEADEACEATEGGINFFSIALGTDVDTDLMKYIARYDESKADACEPRNGKGPGETPDFYQESPERSDLEAKFRAIALYLTSPQYLIVATDGGTTIESRVQHNEEFDLIGIFTWLLK
jgi:hypothetical protein